MRSCYTHHVTHLESNFWRRFGLSLNWLPVIVVVTLLISEQPRRSLRQLSLPIATLMADPGFLPHTHLTFMPMHDDMEASAGFVVELCKDKPGVPHPSIVSFEDFLDAYLTFQPAGSNRLRK